MRHSRPDCYDSLEVSRLQMFTHLEAAVLLGRIMPDLLPFVKWQKLTARAGAQVAGWWLPIPNKWDALGDSRAQKRHKKPKKQAASAVGYPVDWLNKL